MATKMSPDLLTEITNQFSGDALNQISSATKLSPTKTLSAIGDLVPAALSSLAGRATTTEGANNVLDVIRRNNLTSVSLDEVARRGNVADLADTGRSLTDFIFGGRVDSVFDWIGNHQGITRSSLTSLTGICAPVILGLIGRRLGSGGLNESSLTNLLGSQTRFLRHAPAGLAGALGLSSVAAVASRLTDNTAHHDVAPPAYITGSTRTWTWLLPLLLVGGAIVLLVVLFMRT